MGRFKFAEKKGESGKVRENFSTLLLFFGHVTGDTWQDESKTFSRELLRPISDKVAK